MRALRTPILMFHHVEPAGAAGLRPPPIHPNSYLSRRDFAGILDALARRGARTVTLAQAVAGRLPRRAVVLTFDDGCRCFRDHVLPELQAHGMTATLFAVAGELGGTNRWDHAAGERHEDLLDADWLRELAAQGIEIGCHGYHHRDLTACSDAELEEEVRGARHDLAAALALPIQTFCYPYGRLDLRTEQAVEAAGFSAAVGISGRPRALFALPRQIVNPGDSRFEILLKASGAYPLWRRLPRLGVLRALRHSHTP
jgi:peptidoglycan/xylan/chitin deacetylase (PgdA/CDA1 family)